MWMVNELVLTFSASIKYAKAKVKFDIIYSKWSYSSSKVQYFTVKNSHYDTFFPKLKSLAKIVNSDFFVYAVTLQKILPKNTQKESKANVSATYGDPLQCHKFKD